MEHSRQDKRCICRPHRGLVVLALLLACLIIPMSFPALATGDNPDLIKLGKSSQHLVSSLQQHNAGAVEFRTHVVFYREGLRKLMLANEQASDHKIDRNLLMQMVRMAALLQSAADCQTGRYITCPAGLMHELDQQQKLINRVTKLTPNS